MTYDLFMTSDSELGRRCRELRVASDKQPGGAAALLDELTLCRALVVDALRVYEAAQVSAAALTDEAQRTRIIGHAGAILRSTLEGVRDMALAQKRVQAPDEAIRFVVNQAVQVIDARLGERAEELLSSGVDYTELSNDLARSLGVIARLEDASLLTGRRAGLAQGAPVGTDLTPDQDMQDMIATVPGDPLGESPDDEQEAA